MNIKNKLGFKIILIMVLAVLFVIGAQKNSHAAAKWSELETYYFNQHNNTLASSDGGNKFIYPSGLDVKKCSSITLYNKNGKFEKVAGTGKRSSTMTWNLGNNDTIDYKVIENGKRFTLDVKVKSNMYKIYRLEVICKKGTKTYARNIDIVINKYTGSVKFMNGNSQFKGIFYANARTGTLKLVKTFKPSGTDKFGRIFCGWGTKDGKVKYDNTTKDLSINVGNNDITLYAVYKDKVSNLTKSTVSGTARAATGVALGSSEVESSTNESSTNLFQKILNTIMAIIKNIMNFFKSLLGK